jgi:hypothetical protein
MAFLGAFGFEETAMAAAFGLDFLFVHAEVHEGLGMLAKDGG